GRASRSRAWTRARVALAGGDREKGDRGRGAHRARSRTAPCVATVGPARYVARVEKAERTIFLLTREAKERRDGLELIYWGTSPEGPVRVRLTRQRAVFYVPRDVETLAGERTEVAHTTLDGKPVDRVAFVSRRELRAEADRLARRGTPALESDVKPADRALFERFVTGACTVRGPARERRGFVEFVAPEITPADVTPSLRVASFDVEAEGMDQPILSVAIVTRDAERVFVRGEGPPMPGVSYHADE